jgi:hypothetical protein
MTRGELSELTHWAAACAARVVASFEGRHRADERPRQALSAAQGWASGELEGHQVRQYSRAADAAAREANHEAAIAAARACAEVALISRGELHAVSVAAYARVAVAAENAGNAANAVAAELQWQRESLPEKFRLLLS